VTRKSSQLPGTDEERISELVLAHQILSDQGVMDGFGHISVRSAASPGHFLMGRSALVPALVTRDDIIEYDENSQPYNSGGRSGPTERFMHGEIYRVRPDVHAVSHSHTEAVLPFALTKTPLQAVIHTASFLGSTPVPVFEIRECMGPRNEILVDNPTAGAALAQKLGTRSVVLLRGHGMTVAAPSILDVVFWSIYTRTNALIEAEALRLGRPEFLNSFEVDREQPVWVQWDWWAAAATARRAVSLNP
jgi:ribulose-5-phosphate 4-epimerase/fuculose-1-phosphate aldolase